MACVFFNLFEILHMKSFKNPKWGQVQWFKPRILTTWEAEIGKMLVQGQPKQKVTETSSQPVKAEYGGVCPSSQLSTKQK
jgi:hypothetical protein